jgi:hypothetical protein
MLSDAKGIYGGLAKGHERDEVGLAYDALYERDKRQDVLWDSSELNVRSELGFTRHAPSEGELFRRTLASSPADLAYSDYHRRSELSGLLRNSAPARRWDPLDGIDRYWTEHKAEKAQSGDFETRRMADTDVPKEGLVRIVVSHMDKGHNILGLGMVGLTVVQIIDPEAYAAGWHVGDEVQKVNRVAVANELEFKEAIGRAIARSQITASPIIFDVWREPVRSIHHGIAARALPFGAPSSGMQPLMLMGPPAYGSSMMPTPVASTMSGPPTMYGAGPMSVPAGGLQQRLTALAQENALLRGQLGQGSRAGSMW